jgi:hypothetical protein
MSLLFFITPQYYCETVVHGGCNKENQQKARTEVAKGNTEEV